MTLNITRCHFFDRKTGNINTSMFAAPKLALVPASLYQHFKRTGHSPDNVLVQPVEKLIYDENSSVRFNTIKRFETII